MSELSPPVQLEPQDLFFVVSVWENQPTRTVELFSSPFGVSSLVRRGGAILVSGHTVGRSLPDSSLR
jgi:hypothetical protein